VHARGGLRDSYEPVRSPLLAPDDVGDALALARAYRDGAGLAEIYVADLDAIAGIRSPRGAPTLAAICREVPPVMVDAGITTPEAAQHAIDIGARRVVVGLETLGSVAELARIVRQVGRERVVFSLDLRAGVPITRPGSPLAELDPQAIAQRAIAAGAPSILLLDLARVGQVVGPDFPLARAIRAAFPSVELLIGGGISSGVELAALAADGCDGALVGTAFHAGVPIAGRY